MPRRTIHCQPDPVGDRLRQEALESRPAFSEAIHQRILAAIRKRDSQRLARRSTAPLLQSAARHFALGKAVPWASRRLRLRPILAMAVASCILLTVVATTYQKHQHTFSPTGESQTALALPQITQTPAPTVSAASSPTPSRPKWPAHTHRLRSDAERTLASAQPPAATASLDHLVYDDARRAARVLLNRLPIDLALADLTKTDQ